MNSQEAFSPGKSRRMGGGMRRWGRKTAAPQTAPSVEPSGAVARLVVPRAWALLPLRLFLGLTFVDAGVGKLLSSAYFGSGSEGFASLARGLPAVAQSAGWSVRWC